MKKTIAISLITSSLLIGATTVNNLETDYLNTIQTGSTINNSTVHQGRTDISNSDVDYVTLERKSTTGNLIDNVDILDSNVSQATFIVTDGNATGASGSAITVTTDNTITNSTIRDSSTVKQSYIEINDADVDGLTIEQVNTIDDVDNAGGATGYSEMNASTISQGILLVNTGSHVANLTQTNIDNAIKHVGSDKSTMIQNSITVKNGSDIQEFNNIDDTSNSFETNYIQDVTATEGASITQNTATFDNANINGLDTTQANKVLDVDLETNGIVQGDIQVSSAEVNNFESKYTNTIQHVQIDGEGTTRQGVLIVTGGTNGETNATGSSTADSLEIDAINLIEYSKLSNGSASQSITTIENDAQVNGLTLSQTNTIKGTSSSGDYSMDANNTTLLQGITTISDGVVTNFTSTQTNTIEDVDVDTHTITQGNIEITGSHVTNFDTKYSNSITSSELTGSGSTIQGELIIGGGDNNVTGSDADVATFDINATNTIKFSTITDSSIIQSKTTIEGGSQVQNITLDQTNTIEGTDSIDDNNITDGATISQAETIIKESEGTTDVNSMTQHLDNLISNSDIDDSNATQGYTSIVDSDVDKLTQTLTNKITGSDISDKSSIKQGYTTISNSTVDTLTITHTNSVIDSEVLNNSVVTQGMTTIDDES